MPQSPWGAISPPLPLEESASAAALDVQEAGTKRSSRRAARTLEFDLVVVGGGLAGLCAAVSAARNGIRTAIIQDRPVFGGNSSSEIRVVPFGTAHSNAWAAETGIVNEVIHEDRAHNHQHMFTHGMANSLYDMTLAEAVRGEQNVTPMLNTTVRGVDTAEEEDGQRRVVAVRGSQLGSEAEFIIKGRQFIDATGDGTLGFLAGADYRMGREARSEFGEYLAPLNSDDVTMGATLTMRARRLDHPVPYTPPPWIEPYTTLEEVGVARPVVHLEKDDYGGYWWLEVGYPYNQIEDTEAVRDELHRHVLGIWNYIKNHSPDRNSATHHALEWVGQVPGKRESRRLMGDVILTEHDLHHGRDWPDGIGYAGWWIDLHIKGGILNKAEPAEREDLDDNYKHWIRISPFSIPLRASYSRNVANLWMTGRILSVSHIALGPVRVQLTLGQHGQAIGAAAAYALAHGLSPRQLADPEGEHIQTLRQQLLRQDVRLLGITNDDPDDLARTAMVTGSSQQALDLGADVNGWTSLDRAIGQVIPVTEDRLELVRCLLRNDTDAPVELSAHLEVLDRIWDRETRPILATSSATLPADGEHWVEFALEAATDPDRPYRLHLDPAAGVSWAHGRASTGTVAHYRYNCPGGPEARHRHLPSFGPDEIQIPEYEHWRQLRGNVMTTQTTPQMSPYRPQVVTNGRAWPEDMPNVWISDPEEPMPQWLELQWEKEQDVSTVQIAFDNQLDLKTRERPGLWRAPECVRDWRILVADGDGWREVFAETGNYQRFRVVRFEPERTTAIRVVVEATNADPSARIFEIRAYA